MPRYSISNAPTEVVGLYTGSGVFRGRLGDIAAFCVDFEHKKRWSCQALVSIQKSRLK